MTRRFVSLARKTRARLGNRRRTLRMERLDERLLMAGLAPTARNDLFTLEADTTLDVASPGILANDSDPENDALVATLFNQPAHGMLTFNANGSFSYLPQPGFTGTDSFSYRLSDGSSNSKLAAVTLRVTAAATPSAAPVLDLNGADAAGVDFAASFSEGSSPVLIADSDAALADGDSADLVSLTVTLVNRPDGDAETLSADTSGTPIVADYAAGVLTLSGSASTSDYLQVLGTLRYGNSSQNPSTASRQISFVASDGTHASNAATTTVSVEAVNNAPLAVNDGVYSVDQDATMAVDVAAGILDNDSDPEGATLLVEVVIGPRDGTLVLDANGSFSYTPDPGFVGIDGFSYRVGDGELFSDVAAATIEVVAVAGRPEAAADDYEIAEDGTLVVPAPGVLANDSDSDGDLLSAVLVAGPLHGTLDLAADGLFTYTPAADYVGLDSFSYQASDGGLLSAVATVSIAVTEVNDDPLGGDNSLPSIGEDSGPRTISFAELLGNDAPGPANEAGQGLSIVALGGVFGGTAVILGTDIVFMPDPDFFGAAGFNYTFEDNGLTDGGDDFQSATAAVSFTISEANDAPTAGNDAASTPHNTPLVLSASSLLSSDSAGPANESTQSLTIVSVGNAVGGSVSLTAGTITFTPDLGFSGLASFSYTVEDNGTTAGAADPLQATATVTVNVAPERSPEAMLFDFNSGSSPTADGYIGLTNDNAYVTGTGYGWLIRAFTYNRGEVADEKLRDGHWGTRNIFRVDDLVPGQYLVNVTIGDGQFVADNLTVGVHEMENILADVDALPGEFTHAEFVATVDASGILRLFVQDRYGFDAYFRINSLEIRPMESVGEISLSLAEGEATLEADGLSVDTYLGSGAPPNAMLTIDTTLGSIATADLPAGESLYSGVQVTSDASGNFSFQVRRPSGIGAGEGEIRVREVTGLARGSLVQPYEVAGLRRFDFNHTSAATQPGFLDVQGTHRYSSERGFGYVTFGDGSGTAVGTFDRGPGNPDDLRRDGHFGQDREFSIQVAAGVAYHVRVHLGDAQFAHDQIQVLVEGAAVHDVDLLMPGEFANPTLLNAVSSDDRLTIRLTDLGGLDPIYVLNALEIWEADLPAPELASSLPTLSPLHADLLFATDGWR